MKDSRYKTIIIEDKYESLRLDRFLSSIFPNVNNILIQKALRNKDILINDKLIKNSGIKLNSGDELSISNFISKIFNNPKKDLNNKKDLVFTDKEVEKIKNLIVYKDDAIIAINKPFGLAVQSGTKIEKSLNDYLKFLKFENEENPRLIHRIDKDTTGILIVGRNRKVSEELNEFFKEKDNKLDKIYLTIAVGRFNQNEGVIDCPLIKKVENGVEKVYKDEQNGKKALTLYKVIGYSQKYNITFLAVKILTGRTHQIRVHLKEIGHPILCDGKYGGKKSFVEGLGDKLFLHSYILRIKNFRGKNIEIKANLPEKFKSTLKIVNIKFNENLSLFE